MSSKPLTPRVQTLLQTWDQAETNHPNIPELDAYIYMDGKSCRFVGDGMGEWMESSVLFDLGDWV